MSSLKPASSILSICKILRKRLKCLIRDQKYLIWILLDWNLETILSYLKSSSSNLSNCKVSLKNENAYIWDQRCLFRIFLIKNVLFEYFRSRILKRLMSYLKSVPWNLPNCKICKNAKMPKLRTKNAWFGYFWTGIWKQYWRIWNDHPQICETAKFLWKKSIYISNQKCFLWVFPGYKFKKPLSYLKSKCSSLSNYKILRRNNSLLIWHQKRHFWVFSSENVLFWYSWGRIFKILLSYL